MNYLSRKINPSHSPKNNNRRNNSGEKEVRKRFSSCMYLRAYEPSNKQKREKKENNFFSVLIELR